MRNRRQFSLRSRGKAQALEASGGSAVGIRPTATREDLALQKKTRVIGLLQHMLLRAQLIDTRLLVASQRVSRRWGAIFPFPPFPCAAEAPSLRQI